jgi:hypothetical protein
MILGLLFCTKICKHFELQYLVAIQYVFSVFILPQNSIYAMCEFHYHEKKPAIRAKKTLFLTCPF